jgi:hypothetical protein
MSCLSIRPVAWCMQGIATARPLTRAFVTDFTRRISSAASRQLSTNTENTAQQSFPMVRGSPDVAPLTFQKAINATSLGLNTPLSPDDKIRITQQALSLKPPAQPFSAVFTKRPWSLDSFTEPRFPVIVSRLENKEEFSMRVGNRYRLFMDMPIKMPGMDWQIPEELQQFREAIRKAVQFERIVNPKIAGSYVYLTVDQRPVQPGLSQRRTGWHADSFVSKNTKLEIRDPNFQQEIETDSIYLASDCIPTEFCSGPFPFVGIDHEDTEAVLAHFTSGAEGKEVITYPSYTLLRMGPDVVHRVGFNTTTGILPRTFFKLTFSPGILNRDGNGHNSLYDYNWPLVPRNDTKRNDSAVIPGYGRKDLDQFRVVTAIELKKAFIEKTSLSDANFFKAYKHSQVSAIPATPGELLQTELDGFTTTVRTASIGDWKVTSPSGDQYFLTASQMETLYTYDTSSDGTRFLAKPLIVEALQIKSPIQFMAPWGSPQFLRAGDYLVKGRGNGIYGILKKDFERSYTRK